MSLYFSIIIWKHLGQRYLELDVIEDSLTKNYVLAKQERGIRRVWYQGQKLIEQVVKHLDNGSLADGARLEVLHAIFACKSDCLNFGNWVFILSRVGA